MLPEHKIRERINKHFENLGAKDPKVAQRAEYLLIRYYSSRILEQLISAARDPNPEKRFRAAWVLAHTHHPNAYETLLALTRDPDDRVRYDAAIGLGILGDERAIVPLIELSTTPDPQHYVDAAASYGLTHLGKLAVPALTALLESNDQKMLNMAIWALGVIGDESVISKLASILDHGDEQSKITVLEAFSTMDSPRVIPFVEPYLNDPCDSIRTEAEYCLKSLLNP